MTFTFTFTHYFPVLSGYLGCRGKLALNWKAEIITAILKAGIAKWVGCAFTYISSHNQLKAGESQDVYEKAFRGKSEPWTGLLREVAGLHLGSCQGFSVRSASFSFMALMVKLLLFLDSAPQPHLPDGTMWTRIMVQKVILSCCDCLPQDTLKLANAAARCFIDILVPPR